MNSVPSRTLRRVAMGSLLLVSGCQLDVDADLIKNPPPSDGGADPNACPVGFVCTLLDGGGQGDGGQIDDAGAEACEHDGDCASDTFCSTSGSCLARCDEQRGCVLLNTGRVEVTGMVREGDDIYWSTASGQDALSNSLHDGAIWRLNEAGASSAVQGGLDVYSQVVAAIDDHLYYLDIPVATVGWMELYRVPKAGGSAEKIVLPGIDLVYSVEASGSYLWYQASPDRNDYLGAEVWRAPKNGGTPERVKGIGGRSLLAATDHEVLLGTGAPLGDFALDDLSGAAPSLFGGAAWGGFMDEHYAVGLGYDGEAWSMNLDTAAAKRLAFLDSWYFSPHLRLQGDLRGEWLVWMGFEGTQQDLRLVLGRSHRDLTVPSERIAELPLAAGAVKDSYIFPMVVSPWSDEVIYYHPVEKRIFRRALPAFSCASSIPCPDGYACQPDQTCQRTN